MKTPLEKIESTRMVIGALCDGMTASESSSRIGERINELHDQLSANLAELRAAQTPHSAESRPYEYRGTDLVDMRHVPLVDRAGIEYFLEHGHTVERRPDLSWEPVTEAPSA